MTETKTPVRRTFLPDAQVKEATLKSLQFCLESEHLNPINVAYLERMKGKALKGKHLTMHEVAGLTKIEAALKHQAAGTSNRKVG